MLDLFGEPVTEPWPVPAEVARGKRKKRKDPVPRGYARIPGTGPKGETCGTCNHAACKHLARKRIYKCVCNYPRWTNGRGSDIVLKSPACILWVPKWKRIFGARRDPMRRRRTAEREGRPFVDRISG
jgi:hypothetical protein